MAWPATKLLGDMPHGLEFNPDCGSTDYDWRIHHPTHNWSLLIEQFSWQGIPQNMTNGVSSAPPVTVAQSAQLRTLQVKSSSSYCVYYRVAIDRKILQ